MEQGEYKKIKMGVEVLNKPIPKKWKSNLNPTFRDYIIKNYIGIELWNKADKRTRYILSTEALNNHRREMVYKYGSIVNYYNAMAKKEGYKDYLEKNLKLLKDRGFNSQKEYRDYLCKRYGCHSYVQMCRLFRLYGHQNIKLIKEKAKEEEVIKERIIERKKENEEIKKELEEKYFKHIIKLKNVRNKKEK